MAARPRLVKNSNNISALSKSFAETDDGVAASPGASAAPAGPLAPLFNLFD